MSNGVSGMGFVCTSKPATVVTAPPASDTRCTSYCFDGPTALAAWKTASAASDMSCSPGATTKAMVRI